MKMTKEMEIKKIQKELNSMGLYDYILEFDGPDDYACFKKTTYRLIPFAVAKKQGGLKRDLEIEEVSKAVVKKLRKWPEELIIYSVRNGRYSKSITMFATDSGTDKVIRMKYEFLYTKNTFKSAEEFLKYAIDRMGYPESAFVCTQI